MSRIRSFVGLAAVVLLVATASLAQAQNNASYWNVTGPAPWSDTADNWASGTLSSSAARGSPAAAS